MSVSARSAPRPPAPMPSVGQAWMAVLAAFGVAFVAAYQAAMLSATHLGLLPAIPAGLMTFVVVGAIALVAAAHLDERVLSR